MSTINNQIVRHKHIVNNANVFSMQCKYIYVYFVLDKDLRSWITFTCKNWYFIIWNSVKNNLIREKKIIIKSDNFWRAFLWAIFRAECNAEHYKDSFVCISNGKQLLAFEDI